MRKHLRYLVIIFSVIFLLVEISLLKLPVVNRLLLFALVLLLAAIHWDLTDGGLISRTVYYFSPSFYLRNVISIAAAALIVIAFLYFSKLMEPPYLSLFYFPIILSAVRAGAALTVSLSVIGPVVLALLLRGGLTAGQRLDSVVQLGFLAGAGMVTGILVERMHRANLSLGTLFESGRLIGSSLKIDEVLGQIIEVVRSELLPDVCALMLIDKEGNLSVRAGYSLNGETSGASKANNQKSAVYWVAEHNQSLYIADSKDDPHMAFSVGGERSLIAAPLVSQDRVVGVLVAGKKKPNGFAYEHLRFLEGLAAQANHAIENAYLYQETEESAIRDGLTGLYNYRFFLQQFNGEISKTHERGKHLSLIIMDIDYFKLINDKHGHLRGDEILKGVSRLLRSRTREGDLVARYGGEEFVILLPETKYEDAFRVACQLRQLLEKTVFRGRKRDVKPIRLTVSLGVATHPLSASTKEQLLQQADESLYEAKLYRNAACSPFECVFESAPKKRAN